MLPFAGIRRKHRLVTRSDFDGLVCAVLLRELDMIDGIKFVHPKDVQDGKIPIGGNDITACLPYMPGVHLAVDHHVSEALRNPERKNNHILDPTAPSTARILYEHYGGPERFPNVSRGMLLAVDKADAGMMSEHEVTNPKGWELLNFLVDPRTGLGRFRSFRISNYQLMLQLVEHCRSKPVEEILELPDVAERVALYRSQQKAFEEQLQRAASQEKKLVLLDLREEETIHVGNRYLIYALNPSCNASIHIFWGRNRQNTVFAVGKSIFRRSCRLNIGALMLHYGGGGHDNAGTCQVPHDQAGRVLQELRDRFAADIGTGEISLGGPAV